MSTPTTTPIITRTLGLSKTLLLRNLLLLWLLVQSSNVSTFTQTEINAAVGSGTQVLIFTAEGRKRAMRNCTEGSNSQVND
jgi:hypothetical protein